MASLDSRERKPPKLSIRMLEAEHGKLTRAIDKQLTTRKELSKKHEVIGLVLALAV